MSYIKVEDLSLGYDSEIVCSNINFEINKNDYLCIIGENGAGKSTLIKTILDLKEKTGHSTMAVTADVTIKISPFLYKKRKKTCKTRNGKIGNYAFTK